MNDASSNSKKPILVTGLHRSGSTWLASILGASPELGYIREPFHPSHPPGVFRITNFSWYHYVDETQRDEFRSAYRDMLDFKYSFGHELATIRTPRGIGRLVRDTCWTTRNRLKGVRPFVKDPFCIFSAQWLAQEFGMNVGLLIRHPAAFVSSCLRLNWNFTFNNLLEQKSLCNELLADFVDDMQRAESESYDPVKRCSLFWRIVHRVCHDYVRQNPDWYLVRHEDLSARPKFEFEAIMKHWNIDISPQVSKRIDSLSSGDNPQEAATGKTHSLRRNSKANIANWKTRLDREQITTIRRIVEDVSIEFYDENDW